GLDVDLPFHGRAGEIVASLLQGEPSLFAELLVARAVLGQALGAEMALRLDLAEINAYVGDGGFNFADRLFHDVFRRGIFHRIDQGMETTGDDPAHAA